MIGIPQCEVQSGLDVSSDALALPWHPIGPYIDNKFLYRPFTLHPALSSRRFPRIRPNSGLFQGVLQQVHPWIPPVLQFVHYLPMV
jgi:hypothetical protein